MKYKIYYTLMLCFFLLLFSGRNIAQRQAHGKRNTADSLTLLRRTALLKDTLNLPYNNKIQQKYYAGAVSFITGEEMARFRVANNSNMLAGRLPGLTTNMGSDEPGNDGSGFYIRGTNSYNGNSPDIYVDNASIGFAQLDPLEIDQLVVLKDAAANGVYGIHGANKAIAITTRRGIPFQNKINFYSQFGYLVPTTQPNYLGAQDYMTLYNEAGKNDGTMPFYSQATIDQYSHTDRDKNLYPDINWFDELVAKKAMQQKYSLTFSGGNNDVRYFILASYIDQKGLFNYGDWNESTLGFNTNIDYKRYNFRSNLDFKINPTLTVSLDLAGRLEVKNYPGTSTDAIFNIIATYPSNLFPMVYPNGNLGGYNQGGLNYIRNPFGLLTHTGYVKQVGRNLLGTTRIVQDLGKWVKGLSVTGVFSYDNYNYNTEGASMNFATYNLQPNGTYSNFGSDVSYAFRVPSQDQDRKNTVWAKVDYKRSFSGDHDLTANMGFSQSVETPSGDDYPYATQGFFSNVHYVYKKKYIADLTMGYSGSENLAKGKRYGFFPSIAAAWLMNEESFLKNTAIDLLKLRVSYGLLGNSDFSIGGTGRSRYIYNSAYGTGNSYTFGQNPASASGRSEGALANPDVTWETSKIANFGVDAAFFNNKVGATIDVFSEQRYNILAFPSSISSLIGGSFKPYNVGKVNNKGIDWDLYYNGAIGDFSFSVHALGSFIRNKIIFQDEVLRPYAYLNRTGLPVGTTFGLQAIGLFANQAEIDASPIPTFSPVKPGDIKYKDQNGDGRIDQYDQVPIGKSDNPELYYGSQVQLKFKNIDLMVWFQGAGNRTVNVLNGATMGFAAGAKPTDYVLNRWTPATAATADYPELSLTAKVSDNNYQSSTFWNQNGRYLRLKNVEIGYNFSPSLLKYVHLSKARFYVSASNLYTWTQLKAKYLDPEYLPAGVGNYPRTQSFQMGLNIEL
jgi:TonB-linked SusC/RagA family outer membrane protein